MIKVTNGLLRHEPFISSFRKLAACELLDANTRYRLFRTLKIVDQEVDKAKSKWFGLVDKFAERDENGIPKIVENRAMFVCKEGVDPVEAEKELLACREEIIEIERFPFELDKLDKASLSALDLSLLEPFIIFPENDTLKTCKDSETV